MKRVYLSIFTLFICYSLGAQINNGGFEQWENRFYIFGAPPFVPIEIVNYDDPDGWTSLNQVTESNFLGNKTNVEMDNSSAVGLLSAKLTTDTFTIAGIGSLALPGTLFNGEFELDLLSFILGGGTINPLDFEDIGQPYTQKPSKISGYFKYNPVGVDSCLISVILMSQGNNVGGGAFTSGMDTDTSFVFFDAPITYIDCAVPDTAIIIITSSSIGIGSANGVGSTLFVDSIDLFVPTVVVNSAPIARNDNSSVLVDDEVIIPVLENDEDCDNDTIQLVSILNQPSDGDVIINPDGTVTYTPDPGFIGDDDFSYVICDPGFLCDTATVFITVELNSGVEEELDKGRFKLLYNSDLQEITFEVDKGFDKYNLSLVDMSGRVLESENINQGKHIVSLNKFVSGIYLLRVFNKTQNKLSSHKFILTK